ncbi:hypothetical protein [Microbacterium sp.]|uniref:hypothetical protein n=1 Tax=Microbacterium sp. TaxID=51671 RepID=UPI0039E5A14F
MPPVPPYPGSYPGAAAPQTGYPPAPAYPAAPAAPAAPPGAYEVPVGGYAAPQGGYQAPAPTTASGGFLGMLALILALVAAVGMPIIAGITGYAIGAQLPGGLDTSDSELLRSLSPVRTEVLWAEISFWAGTATGIAAIVIGIIAIRKKQQRGAGIAGLIIAVLGAIIYGIVLFIALAAGAASGLAY